MRIAPTRSSSTSPPARRAGRVGRARPGSGRAPGPASLAEYRNRHSVYQFTEAGFRAHRAVESVLDRDDGRQRRCPDWSSPTCWPIWRRWREANADGDAEEVYRKLSRLDRALADIAERAARFYHMLGDLSRTNDARPEVFLAHKDALLAHLRDFHDELQRYSPRLTEAVHAVEETGLERLVEAAAEADERIFRTPAERVEDWRRRWAGLRSWLAPPGADQVSEADRLADVDDRRDRRRAGPAAPGHRGPPRRRQPGVPVAASGRLVHRCRVGRRRARAVRRRVRSGRAAPCQRRVSPIAELIATRSSWWEAPAVELSRTLVRDRPRPGFTQPGAGAAWTAPTRAGLGCAQARLADQRRLAEAAAGLADVARAGDAVLDEAQIEVLLRLLDLALMTRTGTARTADRGDRPRGAAPAHARSQRVRDGRDEERSTCTSTVSS